MKKVIIFILVVLVFYGIGKINKYLSDKIYEDCMAAGNYSHDTCYNAAYQN